MNKQIKAFLALFIYVFLVFLLAMWIKLREEAFENTLKIILNTMVVLFIAFVVFEGFLMFFVIRGNNRQFKKYFKEEEYDKAEEVFEKKIEKYHFFNEIINSKYNLLLSYFIAGDNDEAFELLDNTKWRYYKKKVLFFKALEDIYYNNIEEAKHILGKLKKRKSQKENAKIIDGLLNYILYAKKSKALSRAPYPVVGEICSRHKRKVKNLMVN